MLGWLNPLSQAWRTGFVSGAPGIGNISLGNIINAFTNPESIAGTVASAFIPYGGLWNFAVGLGGLIHNWRKSRQTRRHYPVLLLPTFEALNADDIKRLQEAYQRAADSSESGEMRLPDFTDNGVYAALHDPVHSGSYLSYVKINPNDGQVQIWDDNHLRWENYNGTLGPYYVYDEPFKVSLYRDVISQTDNDALKQKYSQYANKDIDANYYEFIAKHGHKSPYQFLMRDNKPWPIGELAIDLKDPEAGFYGVFPKGWGANQVPPIPIYDQYAQVKQMYEHRPSRLYGNWVNIIGGPRWGWLSAQVPENIDPNLYKYLAKIWGYVPSVPGVQYGY